MKEKLTEFAKTHLVVIITFFALSVAYFHPQIGGKVLDQFDTHNAEGMARELELYHEETGEYAQWTNSMFGGMPAFHVGPHGQSTSVFGYLGKILTLGMDYSNPIGILYLYLLGFYLLLISLRQNPWLSLIGAIAFAFSSYNLIILGVGHTTKAYAIAFMAPLIGGMLLVYRQRYLAGGILFLLALGLEIRSNHLQITYYLMMMVLIITIVYGVYSIREKQLKPFLKANGILLVAGLLAVLPNITSLWVNYAIVDQTTRGPSELTVNQEDRTSGLDRSYALGWSYGRTETLSLMIPSIRGGGTGAIGTNERAMEKVDPVYRETLQNWNRYWGPKSVTEGPVYAGAILVFLCVLGLLILRGAFFWWILVTTLLSIFLAWGKHLPGLSNFFLDHVPLYNKFRTVEMILVIASVNIPLMGMVMLKKIIDNQDFIKKNKKKFLISFGLTGGLALIFYLFPGIFSYITEQEQQNIDAQVAAADPQYARQFAQQAREFLGELELARQSIMKFDAIRSFFFITAAAVMIWLYSIKRIRLNYLLLGLGGLILVDLWGVDRRYLNKDDFLDERQDANVFRPTQADQIILADRDPDFRVLNLTRSPFMDGITPYFHKSIGGYHGAKLLRYNELITYHVAGSIQRIAMQLQQQPSEDELQNLLAGQGVLNMLNMKYIIVSPSQPPILNNSSFGHAWFVPGVRIVENADEEILTLGQVDLHGTAIVDKRFEELVPAEIRDLDSISGSIRLVDYAPGMLKYETSAAQDQLAVFSEIYYEGGWKVLLDGRPADLLRANYVLRAMEIPAGDHNIEMEFNFAPFVNGQKISILGSIIVLIILISAAVYGFLKIRREAVPSEE